MTLSVNFVLEESLQNALHEMKHDTKHRALLATIDHEVIKFVKSFDKTENFNSDLEVIRQTITSEKIEACFVIIRLNNTEFGQVLMVPDTVKPKTRMLYASSSAHLRNSSGLPIGSDTHATKVDDLTPSLFSQTTEEQKSLMTESEKIQEKLDSLPLPPAPSALAGVGCPLNVDAAKAAEDFASGEIKCATFTVNPTCIALEKTFPNDASTNDIVAAVPADHPRYIVLKWEAKTVLVYICPPGIKPKERMPYASSKASFIAQLDTFGVKFDRRIETDEVANLEGAIAESFTEVDFKEVAPVAPKENLLHKGPRMLI